jgi:ribonuclease BN (tRNA processing enzyme)
VLVLDMGPGTMRRLLECGIPVHEVDALLLSHFHPDHSGELVPFLFANKYPETKQRLKPLTLVGGRGLTSFLGGLRGVFGHWIDLGGKRMEALEVDDQGPDVLRFDPFLIRTCPVAHNAESVAFRIETAGGAAVVYSGDTDRCDSLVALAEKADLLICESAMPDEWKIPGHLTPSAAGDLATRAGVGKLVLTHFYPECEGADIASQCRKRWSGPLVLAEDLLQITLES